MTTAELLDKYATLKETEVEDPDYVPSAGEEATSEDFESDEEADSEEEKTESQRKLNG